MKFSSVLVSSLLSVASIGGVSAAPADAILEKRQNGNLFGYGVGAIINALNLTLVKSITVNVSLATLGNNVAQASFIAANPFPFDVVIDNITANASVAGTIYATFFHAFPKSQFLIKANSTKSSGLFGGVNLVQGGYNSLNIVGDNVDITANINLRVAPIFSFPGLAIPLDGYVSKNVTTTYDLEP